MSKRMIEMYPLDLANEITVTDAEYTAKNGKCYISNGDNSLEDVVVNIPKTTKRCFIKHSLEYKDGSLTIKLGNSRVLKVIEAEGVFAEQYIQENSMTLDNEYTVYGGEDYTTIITVLVDYDVVEIHKNAVLE